MRLEVSTIVTRPVATVWEWYAVHHVENHPRWDPDLGLEKTTPGPLGVGSVIRRRSTRFGVPTEGTMEIVEFEPGRSMRVRTRDGDKRIDGWVALDDLDGESTRVTIGGDFLDLDDAMEAAVRPLMERSAAAIKALIESET